MRNIKGSIILAEVMWLSVFVLTLHFCLFTVNRELERFEKTLKRKEEKLTTSYLRISPRTLSAHFKTTTGEGS